MKAKAAVRPYHKYVFNAKKRAFIGRFEDMYRREDAEGFDSWYQDDIRHPARRLSMALLSGRSYRRVLDLGCGKGSFTSVMKKEDNQVTGVDVSETAVAKARARFPDIDFRVMDLARLSFPRRRFDLVLAMEVLSYVKGWRGVLKTVAGLTERLYLTLYVPPRPIGFVKSINELSAEVRKHFAVETEVLLNGETLLVLAKSRG